jgi:hypothetical protein
MSQIEREEVRDLDDKEERAALTCTRTHRHCSPRLDIVMMTWPRVAEAILGSAYHIPSKSCSSLHLSSRLTGETVPLRGTPKEAWRNTPAQLNRGGIRMRWCD